MHKHSEEDHPHEFTHSNDRAHSFVDSFTLDHLQYMQSFEGNRQFIAEKLNEDPQYFVKLAQGQTPKYLIIGCSDSRVPPNDLTKMKPGDIFNHRNIANQVLPADMNVNSVIQYAIEGLHVKHIIVMGHTKCGGVKAAIEGTSHGGMLDLWLSHIKNVYEEYQEDLDEIEDFDEKVNRLCELNVVEQVCNVWKNPYIQKAWKKGHFVWVHGWIFRVETGLLEEIVVDKHMPENLKVFQFNFDDDSHQPKKDSIKKQQMVQHNVSVDQTTTDISETQSQKVEKKVTINSPGERQGQTSNDVSKQHLQRGSSIWNFDNFLHLQSELMHKSNFNTEQLKDYIAPRKSVRHATDYHLPDIEDFEDLETQ